MDEADEVTKINLFLDVGCAGKSNLQGNAGTIATTFDEEKSEKM